MRPAPLPDGRRAVVTGFGAAPLDALEEHLRLEPQVAPDPASLGADDVLIAVRAAGVNWVDVLMTSGQYQHVPDPPYTPGLEFAGEVVGVGSGVSGVAVGARVLADGLLTGPRSLGAYRAWGGFASWALAPSAAVVPLPTGFSFDEGACFLGSAETAYHALVARAQLRAGETLLVLGASGATGLAAVQLGAWLGARVLAVGRSAEKLAVAQACGAAVCVALASGESLRDAVKAATGGRGADVVFDAVGGALSVEGLRACAFGARFVVVGWAGTPLVARGGRDPNALPTNLILMKGIDVLGSPAAIAAHRDPALRAERRARVLAWAEQGALRPHVGATYALDALAEALRAKWEGRFAGNVVLRV